MERLILVSALGVVAQEKLVVHFTRDNTHGEPGIILSNKSGTSCTYYSFDNTWYAFDPC